MCACRSLGFLDVYITTRAYLASFFNLKVPALGQRSGEAHCLLYPSYPKGPELCPTQKDHSTVPHSSAQQNRESLRVRVVGILNSTSSFKVFLVCKLDIHIFTNGELFSCTTVSFTFYHYINSIFALHI